MDSELLLSIPQTNKVIYFIYLITTIDFVSTVAVARQFLYSGDSEPGKTGQTGSTRNSGMRAGNQSR